MADVETMTVPPPILEEPRGSPSTLVNPVPMSFPAILRNKTVNNRFAHIREPSDPSGQVSSVRKRARDDKQGKRWVRRKDNDQFKGNQHIVRGDEHDLVRPLLRSTFPDPLPRYLQRSISAPSAPTRPVHDPHSSNAGRFSLSLKGIRRTLRQQRWRAEHVVRDVEEELLEWLYEGGTMYLPDELSALSYDSPGTQIRSLSSVFEVSRSPLQLVWDVEQDGFTRYVVHCCARYHNVVSYSKDVDGRRLTFLLRPNVTRPDFTAVSGLATPPATETDRGVDDSSEPDTISVADSLDIGSDLDEPDIRPPHAGLRRSELPAVTELSDDDDGDVEGQRRAFASLALNSRRNLHKLEESAGADADAESDDDFKDGGLANSVATLDINEERPHSVELTNASTPKPRLGLWDRRRSIGQSLGNRAPSSPSTSPSPIQRQVNFPNRMRTRRASAMGAPSAMTLYNFVYS